MIPFLKSIARGYASRYSDLSEICFLFPNKRSCTFFLKYLKEEFGRHVIVAPEVKTITDFVGDLSGKVVASRLDMIFMLFESYQALQGKSSGFSDDEQAKDFESFIGWGETVLSDFNEIDLYLADADAVFKNVKDYREISSNFLTEEQRKVMAEYFGRPDKGDSGKFWSNFEQEDDENSEIKRKFIHLWRRLSPLYDSMKEKLSARGLSTTGGMYKSAVERLKSDGRGALPYKKVVAVGFNALSTSEMVMFSEMRDFDGYEGYDAFCDFFWDCTGPVLSAGLNSASRFVKTNMEHFPMPKWAMPSLAQSSCESLPRLRVVASPSNSAQVKIAGTLLSELSHRLTSKEISEAKVAVILPDEGLLLPMLYSLPKGMGNVNLTMGYPLRLTSVVPFVRQLRLLYQNRRGKGRQASFYHRDLRLFLSHPFSLSMFGTGPVGFLIGYIDKHHKATVTLEEIREYSPEAAAVLDFSELDINSENTIPTLDRILVKTKDSLPSNETGMMKTKLEIDHIEIYRDALRRLGELLQEYNASPTPSTIFRLADRLLASTTVGFEGEPLAGLQVMGTLETRSIDFDHLFILSMNERIMPMRARTRSFIPDSLRHAYGMPPSNYAESIFAYYFYRMISRAKEVTMTYDARTGGGSGSGDVSRYVLQLRHLFAKGVLEEQNWKFRLSGKEEYDPIVRKTEEIKARLTSYMEDGENAKNFSVSALNTYRECQVKFFYQNVMGINTDPAPSEYIDAIGVGNILHAIMEHLYLPKDKRKRFLKEPVMMQKETIAGLLADTDSLRKLTTRLVNSLHFHASEDELDTPLTGAAEIVGDQIINQVKRVLKRDLRIAPFKIYGCEIKERLKLRLSSGRTVNFKFAIDRLDEIDVDGEKCLRIVDYKTGRIKLEAEDIGEVLDGDYKSEQVFQLFTYAWLLGKSSHGVTDKVRMEIYDVPKIFLNEENLPMIGGEPVKSFDEYSGEFAEGIDNMLESIFESDSFLPAKDEGMCSKCSLAMLCRR